MARKQITLSAAIVEVVRHWNEGQSLLKLEHLLPVDERKALAEHEGIVPMIMACEYAPELRRTALAVSDSAMRRYEFVS